MGQEGTWKSYPWIVKADPYTVFIPQRLRYILRHQPIPATGAYMENCKHVRMGSMAVWRLFRELHSVHSSTILILARRSCPFIMEHIRTSENTVRTNLSHGVCISTASAGLRAGRRSEQCQKISTFSACISPEHAPTTWRRR